MTTIETVARLEKTMRLASARASWHKVTASLARLYGRSAYSIATSSIDDPKMFIATEGWPFIGPPAERISNHEQS